MIHFAFFGTDEFSLGVLEELIKQGLTPSLVVTAPARPQGRGKKLKEPVLRHYADEHGIVCIQPHGLKEIPPELKEQKWDLFIVASYGKIIPQKILDIPARGALNVHPSLLSKYRGPSPIESVLLAGETETGVTIMRMDREVDHGAIAAQESVPLSPDAYYPDIAVELAECGGKLLAKTVPEWMSGSYAAHEQDHAHATYTKKITVEDGLIEPNGNAVENYRKVRAYLPWPKAYYFHKKGSGDIRVAVTRAHLDGEGKFVIDTVIPAGKKEMSYQDFLRGLH